jgi:hypothetical protein
LRVSIKRLEIQPEIGPNGSSAPSTDQSYRVTFLAWGEKEGDQVRAVTAALLAALLLLGSVGSAFAVPANACNQLWKAYTTAAGVNAPGAAQLQATFIALDCSPP